MRNDSIAWFGDEGNDTQKECFYALNFTDVCGKRCSHFDCYIDHYKIVELLKNSEKNKTKPSTRLVIQIPTEPETSYSHQPRIELVEFICHLASTFNMWFGFSMLSLYYLFTFFVIELKIRLPRKVKKTKNFCLKRK